MEAQRREAEVEAPAGRPKLAEMRLQLPLRLVQCAQRPTGQFQLAGRLQRDRGRALFQADDIVAVQYRRAVERRQSQQQVADVARLAVRRLVGWRRHIGLPEAEFLVLRAETELLRRLASGGEILGHLSDRYQRRV